MVFTGIVLALMVLVIVVFADKVGWFREPPLNVEVRGSSAIVHLESPDENETPVSRVRLKDASNGEVIYEVAADGKAPKVFNFELLIGENSTQAVDPSKTDYRVIAPEGRRAFSLQRGVKYRLTVWGDSWTSSTKSFEF